MTIVTVDPGQSTYWLDPNIKLMSIFPEPALQKPNLLTRLKRWFMLIISAHRIIKHISPDVVISFIWRLNWRVILAKTFQKVPVIASEHTTFDKKMNFLERFARLRINRMADRVTILTEHDFKFLGELLPNKTIMRNPLSFDPLESVGKKYNIVLAAGSLNRWYIKGFDNLLKIWSLVSPNHPDWILRVAGTGDKKNVMFLENLAEANGISDKVEFIGMSPNIEVEMQEAAIFILTSRFEGLPMVLSEAMSQGCASVSFDCKAGPNEIVTHNEDGILVDDQCLEEMVDGLSKLIEDEELRANLSANAIRNVKRFSVEIIADQWEKLFAELNRDRNVKLQ